VLFYNHKQEFIGIDEEGLKLLNYVSLENLLGVCSDVADLFAKEPGYIHNFKNFGWIDFLLHADSDATSAIVHGNGRTFSCTLSVQKLFLCEELSGNGYIIDMTHVKSLSGEEIKPHTITSKPKKELLEPEVSPSRTDTVEHAPSILPDYGHLTPTVLSEPETLDIPSFSDETFNHDLEPLDDFYANLSLPLSEEELDQKEAPITVVPTPSEPTMLGDVHYTHDEETFLNTLKTDKSYRFDPKIAANELGLPVDLIEEFIGDFIQQSHEFKEELFEAALKGDMNNLRILSHKLKGVAANLRIEDAFEALSILNTSNDPTEIEANLKYFYAIIAKLEGKAPLEKEEAVPVIDEQQPADLTATPQPEEDDIYEFTLKHHENEPFLVQEEELLTFSATPNELSPDVTNEVIYAEEPVLQEEPEEKLHYDSAVIAGALGIELPFFEELLEDYKQEASNAAERITGAIEAFDTHAWKKTASELKGISDNLRLAGISDQLAILSQTNDAQEAHKASKRLVGYIAQL
jgi:hypothetical protein